jgi:hypothetical protein
MIEIDKIYKWNKGYIKVINYDRLSGLVLLWDITVTGIITSYCTYHSSFKNAAELTDPDKIYWVNQCIETKNYISFKDFNRSIKDIVDRINQWTPKT